MRYLCLCYSDPAAPTTFDVTAPSASFDDIPPGGRLVSAELLADARHATVVRVRNGTVAVHAGPHDGPADRLAAVLIIEARDFNDAIRIASHMPAARSGSVEVLQVRPTGMNG